MKYVCGFHLLHCRWPWFLRNFKIELRYRVLFLSVIDVVFRFPYDSAAVNSSGCDVAEGSPQDPNALKTCECYNYKYLFSCLIFIYWA